MNQGRPRKEEKLFRRRNWESTTQLSTSYDQEEVHSSSLPRSVKLKRTTVDSMYHDLEAQSVVMARAKEIEATLSPSYPSLIKIMLPSHVTGGFWLGLPKGFCDNHLPKQDTAMVLEDESGIEYYTKFISERTGLSAGWRGFSIAHKLLQGDVLVFHLVMPNKFMVYIVRSNVVAEVDGAVGLGFEACNKQTPLYSEEYIPNIKEEQMTLDDGNGKETNIAPVKEEKNDNPVSLASHIHKEYEETSSHVHLDTKMLPVLEESKNVRSFGSNYMNGIRLSDYTPDFDKVKRLNDFNISVSGLIMGSEISSHIRTKYYENGKETNIAPVKEEEKDNHVSLATHIHKEHKQTISHVHLDTEMLSVLEESENDRSTESENDRSFGSNSMNGIRLSDNTPDFDKVMRSNDFNISVNGLIMGSEISSHIRTKYYENGKETNIAPVKVEENDNLVSLATHIHREKEQTSSHVHLDTEKLPVLGESENDKSFSSNSMNGIRLSDSTPDFEKVERSNDFSISVNGLIMGSEFSSHIRIKHYENGKETNIAPVKEEENNNLVSLATHIHRGKEQTSSHVHLDTEKRPVLGESENDRSYGSNSMNEIRLLGSTLDFNKVKSLNDFNFSVDGLIMDSEFSSQIRTKYYENSKKTNIISVKEEVNDNPVSLATDVHKEHEQTSRHVRLDTEKLAVLEKSTNDRKSFGSNSMNGIRLSGSTLDFDKVKSSNDFSISVNGLTIDSEFSSQVRTKYYELCCSQSSFLHDHILEGLNYKLISEIITETINIADAIRACNITTSQEHLTTWDKTLMAFEGLGMNVGFLRARIYQLLMLSLKPEKRREAELKRECTQQEICMLGVKIMDARATIKQLEAEIHYLDADIENMEKSFREVASAPW